MSEKKPLPPFVPESTDEAISWAFETQLHAHEAIPGTHVTVADGTREASLPAPCEPLDGESVLAVTLRQRPDFFSSRFIILEVGTGTREFQLVDLVHNTEILEVGAVAQTSEETKSYLLEHVLAPAVDRASLAETYDILPEPEPV